jgi:hypothetical protein
METNDIVRAYKLALVDGDDETVQEQLELFAGCPIEEIIGHLYADSRQYADLLRAYPDVSEPRLHDPDLSMLLAFFDDPELADQVGSGNGGDAAARLAEETRALDVGTLVRRFAATAGAYLATGASKFPVDLGLSRMGVEDAIKRERARKLIELMNSGVAFESLPESDRLFMAGWASDQLRFVVGYGDEPGDGG